MCISSSSHTALIGEFIKLNIEVVVVVKVSVILKTISHESII